MNVLSSKWFFFYGKALAVNKLTKYLKAICARVLPYFLAISPNFGSVLMASFPTNSGLASDIRPSGVYATGITESFLQRFTSWCWVSVGFIWKIFVDNNLIVASLICHNPPKQTNLYGRYNPSTTKHAGKAGDVRICGASLPRLPSRPVAYILLLTYLYLVDNRFNYSIII